MCTIISTSTILKLKKALRETQNLRAGCSKAAQLLDVAKRPIPQG